MFLVFVKKTSKEIKSLIYFLPNFTSHQFSLLGMYLKKYNIKRSSEQFFNRLLGVQWLVDLTLHFAVGPNNEQAIPNLLTELNIFSDPDSRSFVEQKSPQFLFSERSGILFPKLFWQSVRKKCSSNREKLLKFETEGQEFANFLRSLEQFIQTVNGQCNFC